MITEHGVEAVGVGARFLALGTEMTEVHGHKASPQTGGMVRLGCCSEARCAAASWAEIPARLPVPHGRAVIDSQRLISLFLVSGPFEAAHAHARDFSYVNPPW
jgi:hypothetical protein